ncbi:DedA family protein [Paenibacillus sp. F411]|uniref:SNARE associated golgi family protein n=1 Tax=Paenibacillus algicola TaxID=2565926 RepID=A0A4P8XN03_9BACL|nr:MULTISPECIES: DedA family protein [Paenibacillus]MBO2945521.1 DedA family protein [Paenibacillus sp. F411]QCT04237.1 SNARE associated golgi family protein [Paenibacillus algicola]
MDAIMNGIAGLFEWIQGLGVFGIMLGLMLEVIPSEIVLAYGGYLVSEGQISFAGAMLFGTAGGVLAQLFVYWIGRYGGRPFLERYGKYLLIHKKHIDYAEDWFSQYGTGVIFTARFVPVVRHAISIPAGISKMNLGRFTLLTTLAVIPWTALFLYLGMLLGDQWEQAHEMASPYIREFLLGALAILIIYFIIKWMKLKKGRAQHGR